MRAFRALLTAAYPLLVYAGLEFLEPRWLALCLGAIVCLRAITRWQQPSAEEIQQLAAPALLLGAVLLGTIFVNDARLLLLVPALVNLALLVAFGRTLFGEGPPLIETFARLQAPDLPPEEVDYCRAVTRVWCGFFLANGTTALLLAFSGDTAAWALYNGLIAYLLMGTLFAVEFTVRSWRFGRYGGTVVEPLFRRLFPRGPAT